MIQEATAPTLVDRVIVADGQHLDHNIARHLIEMPQFKATRDLVAHSLPEKGYLFDDASVYYSMAGMLIESYLCMRCRNPDDAMSLSVTKGAGLAYDVLAVTPSAWTAYVIVTDEHIPE